MKAIKLMADYFCYPLWDLTPGQYRDISPTSLPLSDSLREALMDWACAYDAILDLDNPSEAGFKTQEDADAFKATGYALAERLQRELGSEYSVTVNIVA